MIKILKMIEEHLEEVFCMIVFIAMSLLTFTQVILRYVFNSSIVFSEELSRYLFVWLTFVGIAYGVKLRKHLSVDVFYNSLKGRTKEFVKMIADVLYIVFAVLMVIHSYKYFSNVAATAQMAASMNIHMKWVALAPVVGFVLALYRLLQQFVEDTLSLIKKGGKNNG